MTNKRDLYNRHFLTHNTMEDLDKIQLKIKEIMDVLQLECKALTEDIDKEEVG